MLYTQHSIAILMVQCILVAAMYSLCVIHAYVCYTCVIHAYSVGIRFM